jgi:hypothetical protein
MTTDDANTGLEHDQAEETVPTHEEHDFATRCAIAGFENLVVEIDDLTTLVRNPEMPARWGDKIVKYDLENRYWDLGKLLNRMENTLGMSTEEILSIEQETLHPAGASPLYEAPTYEALGYELDHDDDPAVADAEALDRDRADEYTYHLAEEELGADSEYVLERVLE